LTQDRIDDIMSCDLLIIDDLGTEFTNYFTAGYDFDLTFGLMHTAEKSAEILVKMLSMRPDKLQTITADNFRDLAKDFHVELPEKFLYEK